MLLLLISTITIALMILGSVIAYKKTPKDARFPMQWGMDGKVNWRASKTVAVSLFPAVAVVIIGFLILMLGLVGGDKESINILFGVILFNCVLLTAIHLGFMYFGVRDIRKRSGD